MSPKWQQRIRRLRPALARFLAGPHIVAFVPALALGGYWYGGEGLLFFFALLVPALFAVAGMYSGTGPAWSSARDGETGLALRVAVERALTSGLALQKQTGETTAAIAVELDDFADVVAAHGRRGASALLRQAADRVRSNLREGDVVARLDGPRLAIALGPLRNADLETLLQICARLQATLTAPFSLDATSVYLTASVGFCLPSRAPAGDGEEFLRRAEMALDVARANGPGTIRAFTSDTPAVADRGRAIAGDIALALDGGEIRAWFQPQVSTDTGAIAGFEALARWEHPERGILLPGDFLVAVHDQGLMPRLTEVMLGQALAAMRDWMSAGLDVPLVAINATATDLADGKVVDRVKWQLDRYDVDPARLAIEIVEDVVADGEDDLVVRNVAALAALGCRIDLDDFGTGHASIANINRFGVHRIKIDRSFVARVDRDREQQRIVGAILTMAERLELGTVAEGVETHGEHAILAQMGCQHVQGFSIARPMRFEDTLSWIPEYRRKVAQVPLPRRHVG